MNAYPHCRHPQLRAADPAVEAAVAAAAEARRAARAGTPAASFTALLEPGSAILFNMAFNARWTHAILEADGEDAAAGEERVGVTLRRTHTVFDPVRQAAAEGLPRAKRKAIWRAVAEMANAALSEEPWRLG